MLVVITRADGGISILQLIAHDTVVDDEVAKWSEIHTGEYISHRTVEDDTIPVDRTFRDAWTYSGSKLDVDMPRARNIWRDKLRALRAPKLAALDVEYMRALEQGDTARQQVIAAQKQALRDVTADPAIEAAATPEALKAAMPDVLKDAAPAETFVRVPARG